MLEINLLDIAVAVILLLFLGRGLMRGLTREVSGLIGVVGGFALARHFQSVLQPSMEALFSNQDVAGVVAFLLIFILTLILVAFLGMLLRRSMTITLALWVDHLLGAMAGLAKGMLILCVAFFLLQGFFPNFGLVQQAQSTPFFVSLSDYLRAFLPVAFTYKLPIRL